MITQVNIFINKLLNIIKYVADAATNSKQSFQIFV